VKVRYPALPVIILSASSEEELALEAVRRGAQDYLMKGQISGEMLAKSLRLALERKWTSDRERLLMLSNFVRNTSYDLRTPLAILVTSAYLLKRLPANEMLETIHLKAELTAQLWSADHIARQPVQLDRLIQEVCDRIKPRVTAKHQHLEITTEEVNIMAEPAYLSQAFLALLDSLTPENGEIEVHQSIRDDFAVVEIKGSGIGMTEEQVSKAFDMFWKADRSRNSSRVHHSLGFAIARRIIDLHQGSIEVEVRPQGGTTFTVLLPIHTD
jgi:signal transduction histidine kinase